MLGSRLCYGFVVYSCVVSIALIAMAFFKVLVETALEIASTNAERKHSTEVETKTTFEFEMIFEMMFTA